MKYIYLFIIGILFVNCKQTDGETLSAQSIIDQSIGEMGGLRLDSSFIEFKFRDKHYTALRANGIFKYTREFLDSSTQETVIVKDLLKNEGFNRMIDEILIDVPDNMVDRYTASVNSVHYFSVLPYGLNDPAVLKARKPDIVINGQNYYTIKVTFKEDGGGEDFEDEFLYWINTDSMLLEYLAYSYNEDDGKGMRFREAYNMRMIEGIRFVDYNNYKPKTDSVSLDDLPELFQSGNLELLSKIELEEIKVH